MFYGNFGGANFQSDYYNQLMEARRREKGDVCELLQAGNNSDCL